MVSRATILIAGLVLMSPQASLASAQNVDWNVAGGALFVRPVEPLSEGDATAGPRLPDLDPPYKAALAEAAARYNIDVKLLQALVLTESGFRPDAVSPAGAAGLTQLMPATAAELGVVDRFDPVENLMGGADYLARQLTKFRDVRLALAAYNSGPSRVERLGRVPRIPETELYVATVVECFLALTAGRDIRSSRACRSQEAAP